MGADIERPPGAPWIALSALTLAIFSAIIGCADDTDRGRLDRTTPTYPQTARPPPTPSPKELRLSAPQPTRSPPFTPQEPQVAPPPPTPPPTAPLPPEERFIAGYRAASGREDWLDDFIERVRPCEYDSWVWRGDTFHLSVFQFHPQSWEAATDLTGLRDPYDLYHVGAAVAAWSKLVGPGPPAGWACW